VGRAEVISTEGNSEGNVGSPGISKALLKWA